MELGALDDLDRYNAGLSPTLLDKAFFADKVEAETFVHFGCGDGQLMELLARLMPEKTFIGYDCEVEQITAASRRFTRAGVEADCWFTSAWPEIADIGEAWEGGVCLVLSSVIHEALDDASERERDDFWELVFGSGFDYVAIRDMIAPDDYSEPLTARFRAQELGSWKPGHLQLEYEEEAGPIYCKGELLDFFLTCLHAGDVGDFRREAREYYFAASHKEIIEQATFPHRGPYEPIYEHRFTLPYLRAQAQEQFGYTVEAPTHIKTVLQAQRTP